METTAKNKKKVNKKIILLGMIFVVLAFFCFAAVVYFMFHDQKEQSQEITSLRENMLAVNAERDVAESQVARLERKVGQAVYIDKLLQQSQKYHDPQEAQRKEGHLWVDRKNNVILATLGILNGANKGMRLAVYDGNTQVTYVRVESPLDVISYVYPINQTLDDFEKDYYRVILEE